MKTQAIILTIILFLSAFRLFAQDVPGCTDPQANNYNPAATLNDGSCTYNQTFYAPQFKYLLPEELEETSGLIFYNDFLWTINDSGNEAVLYKIDTTTGNVLQEISISNATNTDWEALAQDENYIFIGDFGNNLGNRDDLKIYRIKKSDIPESGDGSVSSYQISFTYSDYLGKAGNRGENNFDCEAFISIGDSLYLFSKNWEDNKTKLYRLPKKLGSQVAEKVYTYDVAGLITGADYNAGSKEITLIGYSQETTIPFFWILFDYHDNLLFSGNKRRIDLYNVIGSQTEAVAYTQGKHGTISNEDNVLYYPSVHAFYTGNWTDDATTGTGLTQAEKFDFTLSPNPVTGNRLMVSIQQLPPGNYLINIYDTSGSLIQVKEYRLKARKSGLSVKLKVGHLTPGLYFVRMRSANTIVEKKFIKQ